MDKITEILYSPLQRRKSAIRELAPDAMFDTNRSGEIVKWRSSDIPQPSESDIDSKVAEYKIKYDAQEYARNRAADYPSSGDQLDMMYKDNKNSTTTHADAVEAVKTKWPKDNSGPVE